MTEITRDRDGDTPRLVQGYTRRKVARIGRHFDLPAGEVEFAADSQHSHAPIHVVDPTLRGVAAGLRPIRAHGAGHDLLAVIDITLDRQDREVLNLEEEVTSQP